MISVFLWAASLGIYQSYWQVGILILILSSVNEILSGCEWTDAARHMVRYCFSLALSMAVYFIGFLASLQLSGIAAADSYNSVQTAYESVNIENIFTLLRGTYRYFFQYYFHPNTYNAGLVAVVTLVGALIALILLVQCARKQGIRGKLLGLLLFLCGIVPLGGNIVYVFSQGMEHDLMVYSFFIPLCFLLSLAERSDKWCSNSIAYKSIVFAVSFVIIFNSIIYSNQVYVKKHVEYWATYAVLTRIIDRIEQIDGYFPGETPVVFVGNLQNGTLTLFQEYFDYNRNAGTGSCFAVTYQSTYRLFIQREMSYPMNIVEDDASVNMFSADAEVESMPAFPLNGSCKMVNDTVVVKLSDFEK